MRAYVRAHTHKHTHTHTHSLTHSHTHTHTLTHKQKVRVQSYEETGGKGFQCAADLEAAVKNTTVFPRVYGDWDRVLWPPPFNAMQGLALDAYINTYIHTYMDRVLWPPPFNAMQGAAGRGFRP